MFGVLSNVLPRLWGYADLSVSREQERSTIFRTVQGDLEISVPVTAGSSAVPPTRNLTLVRPSTQTSISWPMLATLT